MTLLFYFFSPTDLQIPKLFLDWKSDHYLQRYSCFCAASSNISWTLWKQVSKFHYSFCVSFSSFFFFLPTDRLEIIQIGKKLSLSEFYFIFLFSTDQLYEKGSWQIRHPGNQLTMASLYTCTCTVWLTFQMLIWLLQRPLVGLATLLWWVHQSLTWHKLVVLKLATIFQSMMSWIYSLHRGKIPSTENIYVLCQELTICIMQKDCHRSTFFCIIISYQQGDHYFTISIDS